ncbi:hypothetical protein PENSPDRAFT_595454, partial [Peniophora sp. CONT]
MNRRADDPPRTRTLRIFQQNMNKMSAGHDYLINSSALSDYDLVLFQEPYIDQVGNTRATRNWNVIYPYAYQSDRSKPARAVTLINTRLNTNHFETLPFPGRDVTVVLLKGDFGQVTIFNIYNSCDDSETLH